jgi:hypothetical protein
MKCLWPSVPLGAPIASISTRRYVVTLLGLGYRTASVSFVAITNLLNHYLNICIDICKTGYTVFND